MRRGHDTVGGNSRTRAAAHGDGARISVRAMVAYSLHPSRRHGLHRGRRSRSRWGLAARGLQVVTGNACARQARGRRRAAHPALRLRTGDRILVVTGLDGENHVHDAFYPRTGGKPRWAPGCPNGCPSSPAACCRPESGPWSLVHDQQPS